MSPVAIFLSPQVQDTIWHNALHTIFCQVPAADLQITFKYLTFFSNFCRKIKNIIFFCKIIKEHPAKYKIRRPGSYQYIVAQHILAQPAKLLC